MRIRKFRNEDARKVSHIIKKNSLEVNSVHYTTATMNAMLKHNTPSNLLKKQKHVIITLL